MDWLRSETWKAYERPEDEVTGNESDGFARRAPGTAGMRDGVRYQFYETSDGHVLFQASEREFWENFCHGIGRDDLFEAHPGSKYADHAVGNVELRQELQGHLRPAHVGRVGGARRQGQHPDRHRQHAARPSPTTRSSRTASHVDPRGAARRRPAADAAQVPRRRAAGAHQGARPSASTPTRCSRDVLGYDDAKVAALREAGALG